MIKLPATRKDWYLCKMCQKKLLLFNNIANSKGVFIKCKNCGFENEVIVKNGKVI